MRRVAIAAGIMVVASMVFFLTQQEPQVSPPLDDVVVTTANGPQEEPQQDFDEHTDLEIAKGSTVYDTLLQGGLAATQALNIIAAAEAIFDLSAVKAGTVMTLSTDRITSQLTSLDVHISPIKIVRIEPNPDNGLLWIATLVAKPTRLTIMSFAGEIEGTLWDSATAAGLDARPIDKFTDIFGWQVDFERELQIGDEWGMVIEQSTVDDKPYEWHNILLAYFRSGDHMFWAVRYPDRGSEGEYFNLDGQSVRGTFLKSPLKYSRISSHFTARRFHPVLGVNKPHNGVDYAAPTGTPVRSVGEGKIVSIGRNGPSGNTVRIRHTPFHETAYKHLSKFGAGLTQGTRVKQGDVIGYVGSTGLTTGPHLHFEFWENGKYVDPLGRQFPREKSLPEKERSAFRTTWARLSQLLPKHIRSQEKIAMPTEGIELPRTLN